MRRNIIYSVAFVALSIMLCCMLGYKVKNIPLSTVESFPSASLTASTEVAATQEPLYRPGQFVRKDGFLYIYQPGKQYFDKKKYNISECFILGDFFQEYDAEGNPVYTDIVIPDEINGIPVVAVHKNVFRRESEIRSVTFGKHILEIGEEAFRGCKGLEKINFSKELREIHRAAFQSCNQLKAVIIPEKTQLLEWDSFDGCKRLERVELEGSPEEIEHSVFTDTKWVNSCIKKGIPAIANGILLNAYGLSGHVKITGENVKRIAGCPFFFSKVTSLEIDGVEEISEYGLRGDMKKVKIDNVKRLDPFCLAIMDQLETLIFGENISKIPGGCIDASCSIKTIKMYTKKKIQWGTPEAKWPDIGFSRKLTHCSPEEEITTHLYLYSSKVDGLIISADLPDYFVLHVPAKAVKKYKKYVSCKVVAM